MYSACTPRVEDFFPRVRAFAKRLLKQQLGDHIWQLVTIRGTEGLLGYEEVPSRGIHELEAALIVSVIPRSAG